MTNQQNISDNQRPWIGLLLVAAIGAALLVSQHWPAWAFMWVLALLIYGGFKCLTYWETLAGGLKAPKIARFIYLFCWPGMSLKEFAGTPPTIQQTNSTPRWIAPMVKTLFGAGLVWLTVPVIPTDTWLLRGWVAMIGIIMILHFGTFHLLALALQACGFNARPNMQAPLLARSLAEFWGRRWNTAFNVLADRYGFRLLTPRIGRRAALAVVFLASGVLHEAVITLPARGGYGLPTAYFALQSVGIFAERMSLIRRRPWLNRLFAWLVLAAPLGWLFPPVFVRNVILPMLQAIGATGGTT